VTTNKIIAGLVATVLVLVGCLVAFQRIDTAPDDILDPSVPPSVTVTPQSDRTTTIVISEGDTANGIGEALEEEGVINSARLFRALVGLMGIGEDLGTGEYEFQLNTPILTVIEQLRQGGRDTTTTRVTIPEGLRIEEIAAILGEEEVVAAEDFIEAATDPKAYDFDFLANVPARSRLEGYLFPATYEFPVEGLEATEVVEMMLQAFDDNLTAEIIGGAREQNLSMHELVTLASIVEREAVVPRERPMIARVYLNRIANDMRLQADPTTQYAVALEDPEGVEEFGWWKKELTVEDLDLRSPYNTYESDGLPPGPIAAPGIASMEAVAKPDESDFLFFVACGDEGEHEFAATLADHEANVARCNTGG
jgi:UPF0755 protein